MPKGLRSSILHTSSRHGVAAYCAPYSGVVWSYQRRVAGCYAESGRSYGIQEYQGNVRLVGKTTVGETVWYDSRRWFTSAPPCSAIPHISTGHRVGAA
eukprot:2721361-Rhodomonas_salina.1